MPGKPMDRDCWAKCTIVEQLGNIGSEVGRAIKAKRESMPDRMEGAINRALDLFSATVEVLIRDKGNMQNHYRAREVLLARDQFLSLFCGGDFQDADKVESYFMNFAYMARMKHYAALGQSKAT
ncbi:MAG: hypothetical protein LBU32_28425 [Clostridiales bacterium]|jgi:hypothetical protein|nr:hypothetical protein [Clostridiales bacterium]